MNGKEDIYKILGASNHSISKRAENDFYATPTIAVEKILEKLNEINIKLPKTIIEPGIGTGSIASVFAKKEYSIIGYDIVDRGYPGTNIANWLMVKRPEIENLAIVANFPFKDILEHTEHSLSLLKDGEYLIELAKIQFLEGLQRRELFDKQPPKYVFVFSRRIKCLANGEDTIGSSAICFCWYVFQKGFKGMPQIGWL